MPSFQLTSDTMIPVAAAVLVLCFGQDGPTPPTTDGPGDDPAMRAGLVAITAGFTPDLLSALDVSESDISSIMTKCTAAPQANQHAHRAPPQSTRDRLIREVPALSGRSEMIQNAIRSMQIGLSAEYSVAVVNMDEAERLAEAITAEKRSVRLGRSLEQEHRTLLDDVRSRASYIAAMSHVAQRSAAVRGRLLP